MELEIGDRLVTPWGQRFECYAPGELVEDPEQPTPSPRRVYVATGSGALYDRIGTTGLLPLGWLLSQCTELPLSIRRQVAREVFRQLGVSQALDLPPAPAVAPGPAAPIAPVVAAAPAPALQGPPAPPLPEAPAKK
jgi:hypothetical protein